MKNISKVVRNNGPIEIFIILCICSSSMIYIPFWLNMETIINKLSEYQINDIDLGINFAEKMDFPWINENTSDFVQLNPKLQSKLNITYDAFFFVDLLINDSDTPYIVRFVSLPAEINKFSTNFGDNFLIAYYRNCQEDKLNFVSIRQQNINSMNISDESEIINFSMEGFSLLEQSIRVEGKFMKIFNVSQFTTCLSLFSSSFILPGKIDENMIIEEFIFTSQDVFFNTFHEYSLPLFGILLFDFRIPSFSLLHFKTLKQIYEQPLEKWIFFPNGKRLEINSNIGITNAFQENRGYLINLQMDLYLLIILISITILLMIKEVWERSLSFQMTTLIKFKKMGVNVTKSKIKIKRSIMVKIVRDIGIILIIFTIFSSILLSYIFFDHNSSIIPGVFFFGKNFFLYFFSQIIIIIYIMNMEYQKSSKFAMFSNTTIESSEKGKIKDILLNYSNKKKIAIFGVICIVIFFLTKLIYQPIIPITSEMNFNFLNYMILNLLPIIVTIIISFGMTILFINNLDFVFKKLNCLFLSLFFKKDKSTQKIILFWQKRNNKELLPKSILLISLLFLSFLSLIWIQDKAYIQEKQIYVKDDVRLEFFCLDNKYDPKFYLNYSNMPPHEISRAIICEGNDGSDFNIIKYMWIENISRFYRETQLFSRNQETSKDSGIIVNNEFDKSKDLGDFYQFYCNSSTKFTIQNIYAFTSSFPGGFCKLKQFQEINFVWWSNYNLDKFISDFNPKIINIVYFIKFTYEIADFKNEEFSNNISQWFTQDVIQENARKSVYSSKIEEIKIPMEILNNREDLIFILWFLLLHFGFLRYMEQSNQILHDDTFSILLKYGFPRNDLKKVSNLNNFVNYLLILVISTVIGLILSIFIYITISRNYFFQSSIQLL